MAKKNRTENEPDDSRSAERSSKSSTRSDKRREFLKVSVAAGIGACAVSVPIYAGARMVLAPVFQTPRGATFYPLATVDSLTETPEKFTITDKREDAWMTLPQQKIGSVYLRKVGDRVQAFQALCPHAGCMIQFGPRKKPKSDETVEMFYCPCHSAHFESDGTRLDEVAPRDLDSLDVKIENGIVYVKFENFVFGIAEKRT